MPGASIKSRYTWRLRTFVALIALVVFLAFSGSNVVRAIELCEWMELVDAKLLLSLTLPLATLILEGIVPSEFKAVLVYWKWKNALPGHEAFTVHGKKDSRFDIRALEERHGPLPKEPAEQNQLWYELSKVTADRPSVDEAHYNWLLMRDLTTLSFALMIISAVLGMVFEIGVIPWAILVSLLVLLYIALSQVAANKGVRFVTTVLAEAATS